MSENDQNLESLLERSSATDVPLLLKAKEDLKKKIRDNSDPKDIAALNRVKQMLRDAMSGQEGNRNFPKVENVLAYLQEQGRKISQSQLYKDIKRGYLRRQPDKSFKQRDVDMYASTLSIVSMPEARADAMVDLAEEELKEKIAKTREQRMSLAFDRQVKAGKYILREEVALELSSRAATLALGLRSVFRLNVADYIRFVGGDVNKAEELAQMFEKNLDMALNEYSKPMDFKVEYIPPEVLGHPESEAAKDKNGEGESEQ